MADTVFNIFGTHLQEIAPKRLPTILGGENANVGKMGINSKGITPAKMNKSFTPKQIDLKKKTFMQNEGAAIQIFCPKSNDTNRKPLQNIKKSMNVYEDNAKPLKKREPQDISDIEFTHKPIFYEDQEDDEFMFSDKQMDNIVLGLPTDNYLRPPPMEKPSMLVPEITGQSLSEIIEDDYSELDNAGFSDLDASFTF